MFTMIIFIIVCFILIQFATSNISSDMRKDGRSEEEIAEYLNKDKDDKLLQKSAIRSIILTLLNK